VAGALNAPFAASSFGRATVTDAGDADCRMGSGVGCTLGPGSLEAVSVRRGEEATGGVVLATAVSARDPVGFDGGGADWASMRDCRFCGVD
jgi:hypothetical protein